MDSDELASVKALRKAKKKEIQAWMTAFEEREGRSPEARCAYCSAVGRHTTRISMVFSDSLGYACAILKLELGLRTMLAVSSTRVVLDPSCVRTRHRTAFLAPRQILHRRKFY